MEEQHKEPSAQQKRGGIGLAQVILIVLLTILVTVAGTWWVLKTYVFVSEFEPVELQAEERRVLDGKLRALGMQPEDGPRDRFAPSAEEFDEQGRLKPRPYSEAGAPREVRFDERELNALLANNTDLARKMAIDLSDDLVSVKLLVPMDPAFPVLGGQTLRINAGAEVRYIEARPVVVIRGVSLMGIPLPNAWIGGVKNVDLVEEFGGQPGFWQSFAEGVDDIYVEEGQLTVKLRE